MLFFIEVVELLDELASDPDDKHVPPSVRNSYRCEKVFIKIIVMVMVMVMDLDMIMVMAMVMDLDMVMVMVMDLDMVMDMDNEHFLSC